MERLRRFLLSMTLILVGTAMYGQTEITGTVEDEMGPVIGATVKEKGTSNGTVTDFDGKFKLKVKAGAMLVFSYVGFLNQEQPAQNGMKVMMKEDAQSLQEVVVVGYTTQKKADLTGAISTVSVDELAKQNENNPIKALQGRVPGMNIAADGAPSGSATVRIRGIGTLNNNDPLYIIDGVPTKAGMHELNGNDIESIQVLKDAASASIYGSRAANGVIIITTKKGKEGKVRIDFDGSFAVQTYAHKMEVLNAKQFGQVMWQGYVNDGLDPNQNGLGYRYDWSYDAQGVPVLNNITMSKYLDAAGTTPAADTDWFDQTTRTGNIQQYNVSLSNGSERGMSYFSLGYYKNKGIIKHSDFERFSARMNADYKLVKVGDRNLVTVGENFTLNRTSEVPAPGGFLQNVLQFNPSLPVYTTKGEFAGPVGGYPDRENPLARLTRNSDNRYKYWRMFGDAYLNINPIKDLNIKTTFGIDYAQKEQRIFQYPITEGTVANPINGVEAKQEHWMKWMWNVIATYNFEFGKHRGDILVGTELNREDDTWFSGKKYDYVVLNPDYMWPNAGVGEAEAYGSGEGYTLLSYFGKLNYTFNDRYLLGLTLRYDGSSRFGKNSRYGTFPSVSLGWRISEEKFMESTKTWLDNLKLRASWGQTGNQEISNIARYTMFESNYGEAGFGGQSYGTSYDIAGTNGGQTLPSGFKRNQLGNDDLKWETTTQTNLGLDFGFFHNALYGSFEWYFKKTKDILVYMPGIGVMGEGSSQWINAGEMENTGVELNVGYRGNIGEFSYDVAGNIGTYRNEVTKLPETIAAKGTFGGNGVESVVGHPFGAQVGYVYDGIFKSQDEIDNHAKQDGAGLGRIRWKDLNGDNVINEKDQEWIYSPVPDFTWGLNIYLQYKNLDFTMFWQGVQGVDVISDLKKETDLWSGLNISNLNKGQRLLDAWSPANMDSDIPSISTMDNNNEKRVSSYFVENGSYAKLRTIQLGYNFPESIASKLYMQRLRMYVSAQNLLTIKSKNFTGVDPENANFGYPIPLNVTFGLNISF